MVGSFLKQLRKSRKMTLQDLADRINDGTGNISNYENEHKHPQDPTLMRYLTKGFLYSEEEAKIIIASWRTMETEAQYSLAQDTEKYNENAIKVLIKKLVSETSFSAKEAEELIAILKKNS